MHKCIATIAIAVAAAIAPPLHADTATRTKQKHGNLQAL